MKLGEYNFNKTRFAVVKKMEPKFLSNALKVEIRKSCKTTFISVMKLTDPSLVNVPHCFLIGVASTFSQSCAVFLLLHFFLPPNFPII